MHHRSHDQRGGLHAGRGVCIQRGLHAGRVCLGGRICIWGSPCRGVGSASREGGSACRGVSMQGGLHPGGWTDSPSTTGYGQQAGGTHFTGMHSCLCDLITYDINSTLTLIWSYHPSSIGSFRASRNISPVESMILPLQQNDASTQRKTDKTVISSRLFK